MIRRSRLGYSLALVFRATLMAANSCPNQEHRFSASCLRHHSSSTVQSVFSRALIPLQMFPSSNQHGDSSSDGVIHTSSIRYGSSRRTLSSVDSGFRMGIRDDGKARVFSSSQYLLNFRIAAIRAGFCFDIAFRVCWWSFVPIMMVIESNTKLEIQTAYLMVALTLQKPGQGAPTQRN